MQRFRNLLCLTMVVLATQASAATPPQKNTTPSPSPTPPLSATPSPSPTPSSPIYTPSPSATPSPSTTVSPTATASPTISPSPTASASPTSTDSTANASPSVTPTDIHEIQIPLPNLKGISIASEATNTQTTTKSLTPNHKKAKPAPSPAPDQPPKEILQELQTLSPNNILIQEKGTAKPVGYIPPGWTVELVKEGKIHSSAFEIAPGFSYSFTVNPYQLIPDPTQGKYPLHEPLYHADKTDLHPTTVDRALKQLGDSLDKQQKNLDTLIEFIQGQLPEEISTSNASPIPTEGQSPFPSTTPPN